MLTGPSNCSLLFSFHLFYQQRRSRIQHGFGTLPTLIFICKILIIWGIIIAFITIMNNHQGVTIPVCILMILALVFTLYYQNTRFGRYVYAVGGNAEASYLSGINVQKITLIVFAIMGMMMAVAGIIMTSRIGSASPEARRLLELDAIAACVIGGASLMGGRGSIPGAILGALVMESLNNRMSMANLDSAWQNIIKGLVLVSAVWFDITSHRDNK